MKACAFSNLREFSLELYRTLQVLPPDWGAIQLQNIESEWNTKHRRQGSLIFTWGAHLLKHSWFQTSGPPVWVHNYAMKGQRSGGTLNRLTTPGRQGCVRFLWSPPLSQPFLQLKAHPPHSSTTLLPGVSTDLLTAKPVFLHDPLCSSLFTGDSVMTRLSYISHKKPEGWQRAFTLGWAKTSTNVHSKERTLELRGTGRHRLVRWSGYSKQWESRLDS